MILFILFSLLSLSYAENVSYVVYAEIMGISTEGNSCLYLDEENAGLASVYIVKVPTLCGVQPASNRFRSYMSGENEDRFALQAFSRSTTNCTNLYTNLMANISFNCVAVRNETMTIMKSYENPTENIYASYVKANDEEFSLMEIMQGALDAFNVSLTGAATVVRYYESAGCSGTPSFLSVIPHQTSNVEIACAQNPGTTCTNLTATSPSGSMNTICLRDSGLLFRRTGWNSNWMNTSGGGGDQSFIRPPPFAIIMYSILLFILLTLQKK